MSYANHHIVESYSNLFEGLSFLSKIELIETLSKSLKTQTTTQDERFYASFGAFSSEKSAEEIITDIKMNRKFKNMKSYILLLLILNLSVFNSITAQTKPHLQYVYGTFQRNVVTRDGGINRIALEKLLKTSNDPKIWSDYTTFKTLNGLSVAATWGGYLTVLGGLFVQKPNDRLGVIAAGVGLIGGGLTIAAVNGSALKNAINRYNAENGYPLQTEVQHLDVQVGQNGLGLSFTF